MSPVGNGPGGHWHMTRDVKPRGECAGCDRDVWEPADRREAEKQEEARNA
jgi:hypothetical protein